MIGFAFTNSIGLGTVIVGALVLAVGGLPIRLIQQMREERVELERVNKEQLEELVDLRAKTDLSSLESQNRELHVATLEAIREIANAAMSESEEKLGRLEAAVAGGMAAHTKELHKVAQILERLSVKLTEGGSTS